MIGAIIGDIVGSVYEFDNIKTKDFPLENEDADMTDDSIMTLAVAEMLQNGYQYDNDKIIDTFKKWGNAFPCAGYGGHFYYWVLGDSREPYNSCGNGSAMRISPVGWYAKTKDEVIEFSKAITQVTHNHPEGIKGAEVTAMMVFMARNGASKEELKEYAVSMYPEIEDLDYEQLKATYEHQLEICQITVPQAIYCFLISNDFEDCIRTTISIGGDCDTTSAISCAIAEAYYKEIPDDIFEYMLTKVPNTRKGCSALSIIENFLEYKKSL